jgi:hypothetical protein
VERDGKADQHSEFERESRPEIFQNNVSMNCHQSNAKGGQYDTQNDESCRCQQIWEAAKH